MANFETAYSFTRKYEGGYVNNKQNPFDNGGETYCGISRPNNPNWPGWKIIDSLKPKNGVSIKWNTIFKDPTLVSLVHGFYRSRWDSISGDKILSQAVANIFFDFHVMAGKATKLMQHVLIAEFGKKIEKDGLFGPATLAAMNSVDGAKLHDKYKAARLAYHYERVNQEPDQVNNLKNWVARANAFPDMLAEKKKS